MEIIGVPHYQKMVDHIDSYLTQRYPQGLESLMVELAPQWRELAGRYSKSGKIEFFPELAQLYEGRGARIIYGDVAAESLFQQLNSQGRNLDELTNFAKILWSQLRHVRDNAMAESAKAENPQVVVVGTAHATFLKRTFPTAYYTEFELHPRERAYKIVKKVMMLIAGNAKPDNQIIIDKQAIISSQSRTCA